MRVVNFQPASTVLYAFIHHDHVLYVGKTTQTFTKRMMGYKNPGPTQYTNIKNNANIKALLQQTECIDIYALEDMGLMRYGDFQINLAAGLEDDLIKVFQPEWNCR